MRIEYKMKKSLLKARRKRNCMGANRLLTGNLDQRIPDDKKQGTGHSRASPLRPNTAGSDPDAHSQLQPFARQGRREKECEREINRERECESEINRESVRV